MTLVEWLIRRARHYWDKGQQIPVNLFAEMIGAGLDVEALERQYLVEA